MIFVDAVLMSFRFDFSSLDFLVNRCRLSLRAICLWFGGDFRSTKEAGEIVIASSSGVGGSGSLLMMLDELCLLESPLELF